MNVRKGCKGGDRGFFFSEDLRNRLYKPYKPSLFIRFFNWFDRRKQVVYSFGTGIVLGFFVGFVYTSLQHYYK